MRYIPLLIATVASFVLGITLPTQVPLVAIIALFVLTLFAGVGVYSIADFLFGEPYDLYDLEEGDTRNVIRSDASEACYCETKGDIFNGLR